MTEDEAKTKWCPFVRLTDDGQMYFDNRGRKFGGTSGKDGIDASLCIGSGCMAWRWVEPPSAPNADNLVIVDARGTSLGDGFCGLAGKS